MRRYRTLAEQLRGQVGNLTASVHMLTRLVREQGGARDLEYLSIVNHSLYQLLRTVNHLELVGSEDPVFQPQAVDLTVLCGELGDQVASLAEDVGLSFQYECGPELLLTAADGALLRQALLNLITNAMQSAGPGGHVGLRLSKSGGRAVMTVWDDGPGLQAESVPEDCLLASPRGLGLGLLAARRAASLHGGALVLENAGENGVRAVLSLPLRTPDADAVKSPRMGYDGTGGFSPVLTELSPLLPFGVFLPDDVE